MSKTNNHDGENWPYHPYEGSKPELQGSYVPCATNPCSMHGGSDVMATSSEDAYTKAHENDSFGMSASSTTNNNDNANNELDYNGYTVSVDDFSKSLIKTNYNISRLSDMAETLEVVAPNDDILSKYNFAHYADYEGKNRINEVIEEDPYTPLFRDTITGESELNYGDVDWEGTGNGVYIDTSRKDEVDPNDPNDYAVIIWDNYGSLEVVSKKKIENEAWEHRDEIIKDYMDTYGRYDGKLTGAINSMEVKINKSFNPSEKTRPINDLGNIYDSFLRLKNKNSHGVYSSSLLRDGGFEVVDNHLHSHKYYFSTDTNGDITGFSNELGKQPTYKFDKPIKSNDSDTIRDAMLADMNNNM